MPSMRRSWRRRIEWRRMDWNAMEGNVGKAGWVPEGHAKLYLRICTLLLEKQVGVAESGSGL